MKEVVPGRLPGPGPQHPGAACHLLQGPAERPGRGTRREAMAGPALSLQGPSRWPRWWAGDEAALQWVGALLYDPKGWDSTATMSSPRV